MKKPCLLTTKRFYLKPLASKHASEHYLKWLKENISKKYIVAAAKTKKLEDLKKYITFFSKKYNCIFLRILEKKTKKHIGNIKFYPINFKKKTADMGILIGDPSWRGKGVAKEVILKTSQYLKKYKKIKFIHLGVDIKNKFAIQAYKKAGFKIKKSCKNKNHYIYKLIMVKKLT